MQQIGKKMEDLFVVREAGIVLFFPIFVFDNEPIQ